MNRDPTVRTRLRMAARLSERLARPSSALLPPLPQAEWIRLQQIAARIAQIDRRGWPTAAARLRRDLDRAVATMTQRLQVFVDSRQPEVHRLARITLREIDADLVALEQEFESVSIQLKEGTLSVTTAPIVLEGVDLGRFEIRLRLELLGSGSLYEVRALDVSPSRRGSGTPHPHVHDESLCEGKGRLPLRRALQEGRLFDFFVLVRQILETYNPASAYVSLTDWSGIPCHDCGAIAPEDESTSCERCDEGLCDGCVNVCTDCGRTCCAECSGACESCQETTCTACSRLCPECDRSFCRTCLSERECGDCQTPEILSDETIPATSVAPAPPFPELAAVQPVCVGQVSLSAGSR